MAKKSMIAREKKRAQLSSGLLQSVPITNASSAIPNLPMKSVTGATQATGTTS
ncbi:MAG: hypothetical protein CM1200mP36_05510 [Gammaproteobacteria bacterium]|nr:MAG: hypothetical protein CM1200mP36_05510 [Gammaproteobacteria bacterium]